MIRGAGLYTDLASGIRTSMHQEVSCVMSSEQPMLCGYMLESEDALASIRRFALSRGFLEGKLSVTGDFLRLHYLAIGTFLDNKL